MQGGVGIPILNAPPWISSIYGHFFIDVFKNLDQWIRQVAYEVNSNRMYIRACLGGSWSPWELIATATKPQEYNIPFQSGWQAAAKATYCKTQEEVCVVNCSASGSGVASSNFIAALPAGFRPSATVCETAHVYKNGVRDIAEVHIGSGGDIVVYSPIEFDSVSFGVSFVIGFNYRQ